LIKKLLNFLNPKYQKGNLCHKIETSILCHNLFRKKVEQKSQNLLERFAQAKRLLYFFRPFFFSQKKKV
jgi:hypothetical protein